MLSDRDIYFASKPEDRMLVIQNALQTIADIRAGKHEDCRTEKAGALPELRVSLEAFISRALDWEKENEKASVNNSGIR